MEMIDQLYEAAWAPELWPSALGAMGRPSSTSLAVMLIFRNAANPLGTGYNLPQDMHEDFISERWKQSPAITWALQNGHSEFTSYNVAFSPEELAADRAMVQLYELGLGDCLTSMLPLGSGDIAGFMVTRARELGDYKPAEVAYFDAIRPHLVRSVMVAARLGLEAARSTVDALERLGLAAAVIGRDARVIASNAGLDNLPGALMPTAFGGIALSDRLRNNLFKTALTRVGSGDDGPATSIPIAGSQAHPPMIVHLLPVRGRARDILNDGHVLLVASPISPKVPPRPDLLRGLFDLSAAEARLVGELALGGGLPVIARRMGLSIHTLRVQLRAVMAKTGVHRQAELMRLISDL